MIKMIIMMVIFIGVFTQTCDFVKSWIINLFHLHQGVNIHSTYSHLYHSQSKRCRKRRFVLIVNGMRCCVWICSKLGCWWTNRNTERIAKEVNYWVSGVKSGWYDQKQKTKTRLGRCLSYCYWEGVYFFYPGNHEITSGACDQIISFYLHIYNIIHAIFGKLNISCNSIYYIYKKYDMKFYL